MSQAELVRLLLDRPDDIETIAKLYTIMFGRPADPAGLVSCQTQLASGITLAAIADAMLHSDEQRERFGLRDMVQKVHLTVFGHPPPAGDDEIAALVQKLVCHSLRPLSPDGLLSESQAVLAVTRLYRTAYGRPPDAVGMRDTKALLRGGESLEQVIRAMTSSAEFARQGSGNALVARLYRNRFANPDTRCSDAGEFIAALVMLSDASVWPELLDALFPCGLPLSDRAAYQLWIRQVEGRLPAPQRPPDVDWKAIDVTWVIVVDHPQPSLVEYTANSVLAQEGSWELIITWSGNPGSDMRGCMARVKAQSARVLLKRADSPTAAARMRVALRRPRGQFTGLLRPGDRLDAAATLLVAADRDSFDILVTDTDKETETGDREEPDFGVSWDPDALLGTDRSGFPIIRSTLLHRLGDVGEALAEVDLLLRASMSVPEERIAHVPRTLRHRRVADRGERYPAERALAIRQYLGGTTGAGSVVSVDAAEGVRIIRPLPEPPPLASIIIPTRDMARMLSICVESILRLTSYPRFELLIIDNGSTETETFELFDVLRQDGRVRVIHDTRAFNWSRLNNAAVQQMGGEVAVFLNNDTEVFQPDWLRELVSQAMRTEVGAAGALLLYPDRTVQHAGIVLGPDGMSTHVWRHSPAGSAGYRDQLRTPRRVTAVTGACLATRREVFQKAGGFEEEHLRVTWSDVDYCLRVRALGLHVLWTPYATLVHHEQATRGSDVGPAAQQRLAAELQYMRTRWNGLLDVDAFWSPNLFPSDQEPALAFNAGARASHIRSAGAGETSIKSDGALAALPDGPNRG